jgi:exopolysaccharide production protein ExoQ
MGYHSNIAVWATVLYLMVSSTRILSFWQEDIPVDEIIHGPGQKIISIIGIAVAILIVPQLLKNRKNALRILRLSRPLVLVFIFSFLSCLWSEVPFIAFRRVSKVLIMVICVLALLSENDFGASFKRAIFTYITFTILISLVLVLFFPEYSWMRYGELGERLLARGIMPHKSEFSEFCAVSILFVLWIRMSSTGIAKNKEVRLALIGIISLFLLSLAKGVNPSLNLCLALFCFLFGIIFNRIDRKRTSAFLALVCLLISGIILLSLIWINYIPDLPQIATTSVGKDLTFSGRISIWGNLMNLAAEKHPFLGSGFGSFFLGEKTSYLFSILPRGIQDAHSGYLKLFLELGVVGTFIFCFFLGHLAISIFTLKNVDYKDKSALQAMLCYAVFYNIVSNSFLAMRISFLILITITFYSAAIKADVLGQSRRT